MSGSLATSSMRNPAGTLNRPALSSGESGLGASSGFGIWPRIVPGIVMPISRRGRHKCLVRFIVVSPQRWSS